MKKYIIVPFLVICAFASVSCGPAPSKGEKLLQEAVKLEKTADYFKAKVAYKNAYFELIKEGKTALADTSRTSKHRMTAIAMTYPLSAEAVKKILKKTYPTLTAARIESIIKEDRLPHMMIGGKKCYFVDFLNTAYHLYPDLRAKEQAGALGMVKKLASIFGKYYHDRKILPPGRTLTKPITYIAQGSAKIERKKLPAKGMLKIWMPLPLVTSAQQSVDVISIFPESFIKYPIKTDGDIGICYFEIPLEKLKGDLKFGVKLKFTHFEEKFRVGPASMSEYDRDSSQYKRYTASGRNILVTPEIKKTAEKLMGNERDPFKIAKKFYDHIVYDLDYSFMPHAALGALDLPESVYVHEHGYGDCGAQSIYFAALCRAVGIPARASGGMQLFPNPKTGCGDHFWAQFYVPKYGWVPADTSAGQLAKYLDSMPKKEQKLYIDYFLGNMDPFRYLIQVDVDVPFIPPAEEKLIFPAVLQNPTAVCREMIDSPEILLMDAWKIYVKQVGQKP